MTKALKAQRGFALLVAMPLLLVLAILSVNGMTMTAASEKMSGGHMDRARAMAAAEQALQQGLARLQANADTCLAGCAIAANTVTASAPRAAAMPAAWSDDGAIDIAKPADQKNSARYSVSLLGDVFVPSGKTNCMPYSIMGRGVGIDSRTAVVLQITAFLCPI